MPAPSTEPQGTTAALSAQPFDPLAGDHAPTVVPYVHCVRSKQRPTKVHSIGCTPPSEEATDRMLAMQSWNLKQGRFWPLAVVAVGLILTAAWITVLGYALAITVFRAL